MPLVIVAIGVVLLLLLMIRFKLNGFIALVLVALAVGLMQGMPLVKVISSIKAGVGGTLGSLALIMGFGAMLGKMLADCGGAQRIATTLIAKFGSFAEVVHAPEARLREIRGHGDAAVTEMKLIAATASRVAKGQVKQRTMLSSWSSVIDYCRTAMAFADKEQFRILFLDKRNQLIADELQQVGTVDHTPVYPREVVKRALELSATAIILVHNHPSGDPTPSQADIQMTKSIVAIAAPLGISVHDHIIVGKNGKVIYREAGSPEPATLLDAISTADDVSPA